MQMAQFLIGDDNSQSQSQGSEFVFSGDFSQKLVNGFVNDESKKKVENDRMIDEDDDLLDDKEEEKNNGNKSPEKVKDQFIGFTMGNKKIVPSSESMEKARKMFGMNEGSEKQDDGITEVKKTTTTTVIPNKVNDGEQKEEFVGFVMGKKKVPLPSAESMEKARKMFNMSDTEEMRFTSGIETSIDKSKQPDNVQQFSGFMMGGKKAAIPSKEAMDRVKSLFASIDDDDGKISLKNRPDRRKSL